MAPLKYVALGSSVAAGPGIQPITNRFARRSANNYPNILAKKLGAELTDLSASGATLKNILSVPQTSFYLISFEPQIKGIPADADIVTISAGGNDIGYITGIMRDTWSTTFSGRLLTGLLPTAEDLSNQDVADRFTAIIDEIRKIVPKALIVLVEYPTVFGSDKPIQDIPLDKERIRHHRTVADSLEKAYQLAAKARPGVKLVSVGERSREHAVGSKEPWVSGNVGTFGFHPNLEGMQAVADMVYQELKSENLV
ncbi:hypothetical protein VC83_07294 [Pseudogymnoascus destructans]|uniref:SGNH hydrolase-type esterase domain-containing protein n=2 Tax=Pseudogymnoascus destructans TaxID=655981 RepID=L8FS37_PSED2|nr:uncharacterized protein VC83_07294 [Pseudogymnoascus destructans]ELR03288.1 hypothetical protein GMDG_06036 [Pseudogymnoascus destructans 20631-21]OAF56547.1 hypothetical protein VC83_07294 [Pseudogymnoascus destructans]